VRRPHRSPAKYTFAVIEPDGNSRSHAASRRAGGLGNSSPICCQYVNVRI
jgi:hypothetical protein